MSIDNLSKELIIYIINLKHRKDRLESTLTELKKIKIFDNIDFEIIDAYDDIYARNNMFYFLDKSAVENIKKYKNFSTNILPTWGSAGWAISHIKCWEKILNSNYIFFLIIEDDILIDNVDMFSFNIIKSYRIFKKNMFNDYLPNKFSNTVLEKKSLIIMFNSILNQDSTHNIHNKTNIYDNETITNWVNLNYTDSSPNIDNSNDIIYTNLYNDFKKVRDSFINTHCYMMNKYSARVLLNLLLPIQFQISIQLGLFAKNNYKYISIYNLENSGITQNSDFISDVQYYKPDKSFLKKNFNLSNDICEKIYKFL